MTTRSLLPLRQEHVDARSLLTAATAGARRALRGYSPDAVEEAAANAVASVVAALQQRRAAINSEVAVAAVAGRNCGTDMRRTLERGARRTASLDEATAVAADDLFAGLQLAEARIYLADAAALASAMATQRGTRELAELAAALGCLSEGRALDVSDAASRRRLARAIARLLPLLAA